jgi:hypothetical protein
MVEIGRGGDRKIRRNDKKITLRKKEIKNVMLVIKCE